MENKLAESVMRVCNALNKYSVEYLIIGGTAVAYHGYSRLSHTSSGKLTDKTDLDYWFNPTYQNYFNVLKALEELGLDASAYWAEVAPDPHKSFFRLEFDDFTLDLLPEIPGLSKFRHSFQKKSSWVIDKVPLPVIGYDDLIANKKVQARPKDLEDIEELEKRRHGL